MAEQKKFRAIRGVRDILPPDTSLWNWFERTARQVLESYGYREIRLPVFEETQLFARSVGTDTDIVSKEMYTFPDPFDLDELIKVRMRKGVDRTKVRPSGEGSPAPIWDDFSEFQWLTLRPEATASVVRAYIEHGMHTWPGNVRLYYVGPMFRRERPQKGRYRQFYQIGAEVLGRSDHPAIDAELIEMLTVLLGRCRIERWTLLLNSIGCANCRPKYVARLREALFKVREKLGPDSQRRMETNPLRVLDSKLPEEQPVIETLPRISDYLCEDCREHFTGVQEELKLRGIAYEVNWRLVRGLDYYMRTTFEITSPALGAQNALVGGGRYDGLSQLLGGPPATGIGFALGEDRFLDAIKAAGQVEAAHPVDVLIAWIGAAAYPAAVKLARSLRDTALVVEVPAEEMKLKKSLGLADKLGARYALLLGESELASGQFVLRRMADGGQKKLTESELVEYLKSEQSKSGSKS
ncbi:MAG TPA: histidine--tRNA ligase [Candidatus Acidoferrales bacterium]|nr:histidine--tRNA ligase [Candidatus Acidoferrales bacterium]